ncbi:PTS cellobiose transporter subunit IIC [Salicibibacter cibi]|uniref:Permease IIC component n=1 Tax=Salicibibacter cibi TaxID=2743001 RepID=A0A7T6ZBJ2_9BACI|nr:PTS cellobiose transporter subunit IIC [Salicibibacter cibi]QQK80391.1 PTS cellobiose transporter subunit IIC [Salicibibacter cibi]
MANFTDTLDNKIMPMARKLSNQKHLVSIRDGIVLVLPIIIIGSIFLILLNLPIPGYEAFMTSVFGENWDTALQYPVSATFDIIALIAAFGIAYRLAEKYDVDAISAGVLSVAAFLLATPYEVEFVPNEEADPIMVEGGIPVELIGPEGLFVAIIIALFSTEIYRFIIQKNFTFKMPEGVPPAVSKSFMALVPAFIVIVLVWLVRLLIEQTIFGDIHELIYSIVGAPLTLAGGGYIGTMIAILFQQALWAIGIHGAITVSGVMSPVWYTQLGENQQAFAAGEEIPNVVTPEFITLFVNTGGSGATIALVILMVLLAKSAQMKQMGRLNIGPSLFGVNEPLLFGVPIVLNPLIIIPFILTPLAITTITFVTMSTGLVAKPAGIAMPFTMPPIISGYLATGGQISGAVIQFVNILVGVAIYFGFFKIIDRSRLREEQEAEKKESKSNEESV